jgi:elongation factor G
VTGQRRTSQQATQTSFTRACKEGAMGQDAPRDIRAQAPRAIALVGPFQSGKTTLLEAILARCGALSRAGRVSDGSAVGDRSPEARAHQMSVEPNVASATFLGTRYHFIDCPGSVEFLHDMRAVLPGIDAAVVVCEADERKLAGLELVLRELEEADVPRLLFLNKIDTATRRVRETIAMLQQASRTPLLLRQIPLWKNGIAVGFIDLALERAYIYREHAPSEIVALPSDENDREKEARFSMLERLADHDDALMENLLSDLEPPRDQIFDDLAKGLNAGHVAPVLIGSAQNGNGVTRLLKALRHEAPGVAGTRGRVGIAADGPPLAQVLRTVQQSHGGKLSIVRVLRGRISEGDEGVASTGTTARVGGVVMLKGQEQTRQAEAIEGDVVGLARLDPVMTGDSFAIGRTRPPLVAAVQPPEPVHSVVLSVVDHKDDARLAAALAKLTDEDIGLAVEQRPDLGETRLNGQGEIHLKVAIERLAGRFGVRVETRKPAVACRETLRQPTSGHGRHKKQSGGHGQFADVTVEVRPLPRGEGFRFVDRIHGGVVPRQFIPSVEAGAREFCEKGPLGHPIVDIEVTLTDGSAHAVDSSDMAFRQAAKLALAEAWPAGRPVLLEPILAVEIMVPTEAMSRAAAMVSGRRGQIVGYDARPGWRGWDVVKAMVPEAELHGFIIELRSATAGVGTFTAAFDHLAETQGAMAGQKA